MDRFKKMSQLIGTFNEEVKKDEPKPECEHDFISTNIMNVCQKCGLIGDQIYVREIEREIEPNIKVRRPPNPTKEMTAKANRNSYKRHVTENFFYKIYCFI